MILQAYTVPESDRDLLECGRNLTADIDYECSWWLVMAKPRNKRSHAQDRADQDRVRILRALRECPGLGSRELARIVGRSNTWVVSHLRHASCAKKRWRAWCGNNLTHPLFEECDGNWKAL